MKMTEEQRKKPRIKYDNCLVCLMSEKCTDTIERDCKGRFLIDNGMSAYYLI